jgi:hypothetical protein
MIDYGSQKNKLLLSNPYLQSVISTLTDMQDVVFKYFIHKKNYYILYVFLNFRLGYFEIKNSVQSWSSLGALATTHYKNQVNLHLDF